MGLKGPDRLGGILLQQIRYLLEINFPFTNRQMLISCAVIIVQMTLNNTATQGSKPLFQRHGTEHIKMAAVKTMSKEGAVKLTQNLYQG